MKKLILQIIVIASCFSPHVIYGQKQVKIQNTVLQTLDGYESSILQREGSIEDFIFLDNDIYLLGAHSLWQWNLATNSLKKIPLQKKQNGVFKLKNLGTDGFSVFAASSSQLYQYSPSKQQVFKYASPFGKSGLTLGFSGEKDNFWWIHSKGIIRVDQFGRSLIATYPLKNITRKNPFAFDYDKKYFWYLSKNNLKKVDFNKTKLEAKTAFATKSNFKEIALAKQSIILMSNKSVLRLSQEGDFHQAIPVEGRRTISAMEAGSLNDRFLFSDGLLETYNHKAKSVTYHSIKNLDTSEVKRIKTSGDYLVLKSKDAVLVYKLAPH